MRDLSQQNVPVGVRVCVCVCAWVLTRHNLPKLTSRVISDPHHTVRHLKPTHTITNTLENPTRSKNTRR